VLREPIASSDAIWLQDSAANPMVINTVVITDQLDCRTLKTVFQQRILEGPEAGRFERLRCRIGARGHRWYWERDPDFDLDRHIVAARAQGPQGPEGVQAFVGEEAGKPLDWDHPPWRIQVIQGIEEGETVLLVRVHHSIGDGTSLLGLLFAMVDEAPALEGGPARTPAPPIAGVSWLGRLLHGAAIPLHIPGILLRRLTWAPDRSPLHGPPLSGTKRVAWTRPLDLDAAKHANRRMGATVNDMLMASVSGAFCQYLEGHGNPAPPRFLVSMPVNMRAQGQAPGCGNRFAPVPLELPAGPGPQARRILAVKASMDRMKCSAVPMVIYNLQRALISWLPQSASRLLIDFLANKCTAVVTNVRGPSRDLALAGRRVRSIVFWVPQRARIGVGISILSFSGKVQVGVIADAALVPDPAALVQAFEQEFEAMKAL
jgi:WS/DGAT/MGAT family acyltransferase